MASAVQFGLPMSIFRMLYKALMSFGIFMRIGWNAVSFPIACALNISAGQWHAIVGIVVS